MFPKQNWLKFKKFKMNTLEVNNKQNVLDRIYVYFIKSMFKYKLRKLPHKCYQRLVNVSQEGVPTSTLVLLKLGGGCGSASALGLREFDVGATR